jgi:type III secretion protein Y
MMGAADTGADRDSARLLHALGYLHGQHGETKRGLVLLLIAARLAPDDAAILRTLAHAFLADGAPDRAIAVIDRLRAMDDANNPVLDLLMGRALWACGRETEARHAFRDFLQRRSPS